jgi:hypothetical protein
MLSEARTEWVFCPVLFFFAAMGPLGGERRASEAR